MRLLGVLLLVGAGAIAARGADNAPAVPTAEVVAGLIEALRDADYEVRFYVASALAAVGNEAVDPLIKALADKAATTRSAAAYALGQMGATAAPATGPLLTALKDADTDVRRNTALALGRVIAGVRANNVFAGAIPPPPLPAAPPPVFPDEKPRP